MFTTALLAVLLTQDESLSPASLEASSAAVALDVLTPANYDRLVPGGKEVDAIYGDLVLRNAHLVAVIAQPKAGRNANLTVKDVGGCVIDLATAPGQPDELAVYRPGGIGNFTGLELRLRFENVDVAVPVEQAADGATDDPLDEWRPLDEASRKQIGERGGVLMGGGSSIELRVRRGTAFATYALAADDTALRITASGNSDELRVDTSSDDFATIEPGSQPWAWIECPWWRVAYGVASGEGQPVLVSRGKRGALTIKSRPSGDEPAERRLAVGATRLHAQKALQAEEPWGEVDLSSFAVPNLSRMPRSRGGSMIYDRQEMSEYFREFQTVGHPNWIATLSRPSEHGSEVIAHVRVDADSVRVPVPPGPLRVTATALGSVEAQPRQVRVAMSAKRPADPSAELFGRRPAEAVAHDPRLVAALSPPNPERPDRCAKVLLQPVKGDALRLVQISVHDENGWSIPAKVMFERLEGAPVNFGPISEVSGIRNLQYLSGEESKLIMLPAGAYRVTASRGPEYNLAVAELGEETPKLDLTLTRAFETRGWISTDFHSHSTPSGDNTSHQRGRVLNLVCEDIDFAPCTEHQRVDSYQAHIDELGLQPYIGSASGMELTGAGLPILHHNVFPLIMKARTQDGGGPLIATDPDVQIERIALWDERSEKLIQQNHPDLRRLLEDRDNDMVPDEGFARGVGLLDCVEIHPIEMALQLFPNAPERREGLRDGWYSERITRWLDHIKRKPLTGVINTDAHWNYHGSGWTRNWVAVDDDDPATVDTLDVVRATEAGRVVMSNGPYLQMTASAGDKTAQLGDTLIAEDGGIDVTITVHCADWLDVDRVGLVVSGTMTQAFLRKNDDPGFNVDRPLVFQKTVRVPVTEAGYVLAVCGSLSDTLEPAYKGGDAAQQNPAAMTNAIYFDVE